MTTTMAILAIHLPATFLGFWRWLVAYWPAAPHGCQWQYGHGPGQVLHWVRVCHASAALRHWPILAHPASR
jgi:hypothetical protein